MNEKEEAIWTKGYEAATTSMMQHCNGMLEERQDIPTRLRELHEVRNALKDLAEDLDMGWDDDLWLADFVEKHLARAVKP